MQRLRTIALALPEAIEAGGVAEHTFRVRAKIFALYQDNHHGDGRVATWCKAAPGVQGLLVSADPGRFFAPPYVGPKGWIGIRLDGDVDWHEVGDLIRESYRLIAPKRLVSALDRA